MRSLVSLVFLVALVASSCGGGSDQVSDSAAPDASETNERAAADSLGRQFGDDGAFAVAMFAFERGYSKIQVVEGALAESIGRDGAIANVDPVGEPLGLIVIDTNTILLASFTAQEQAPVRVEAMLGNARRMDELTPEGIRGFQILRFILLFIDNDEGCGSVSEGRECTAQEIITAIILFSGGTAEEIAGIDVEPDTIEADLGELDERTVRLVGSGSLVTTDKGGAVTCESTVTDVQATIFPDNTLQITYTRLIESGLPPGETTGGGDTSQYVECIEANRSSIHRGTFDVAAGTVGAFETDAVTADLLVTVSDDGVAAMTGVITVNDFLQEWTLDVILEECTRDCN